MSIRNKAWYTAGFHVTFYSLLEENLGEYDTGYLEGLGTRKPRDFKIPKSTYRVHVYMAIKGGKEKTIDFYADESAVNESSRIELTSDGSLGSSRFEVKTNNGWSEKKPESSHRGVLTIIRMAGIGNEEVGQFKATFYKDGQKLGEESLNLFTGPIEDIKIPDYTNRIDTTFINMTHILHVQSRATFKLAGKASSTDVITLNVFGNVFGFGLYVTSVEFNYPECWEKIK